MFSECSDSSKSTVEHSITAMELVDKIHLDAENGADDVIFVCTSTASASADESDAIQQRQQQLNEQSKPKSAVQHSIAAMELVDENGTDDVIFVCSSTASASADESDAICYLPLTNRVLPPFPSLDANLLGDFNDIDEANETSPAEKLAQTFSRQNIRAIDRAKAILQLFDSCPISAADTCEQKLIEEDKEIQYIRTVKKNSGIICYPGSLATRTLDNAHSMDGLSVNSELFNVDNANSLGKYWAGLNVSWHGIKVRTEKSNSKNNIKLSTLLLGLGDEESFEIDAQRQFIIHFGNENEFFCLCKTVDEGEPFEIADDKAKREAFTELAPKGVHLKDLVGFWILGLDVLPWMYHEVELFVNRSCGCPMEAWFIRPTDGVEPNDPKEPLIGIGGPKAKCIANITMEVPLNNSLKANH